MSILRPYHVRTAPVPSKHVDSIIVFMKIEPLEAVRTRIRQVKLELAHLKLVEKLSLLNKRQQLDQPKTGIGNDKTCETRHGNG